MGVVSYIVEEVLLAFTALGSIHTVTGFHLLDLGTVAVLGALAALTALAAFTAFTAAALAGGGSTGGLTGVWAFTAGGGIIHLDLGWLSGAGLLFENRGVGLQGAQLLNLTFDLCAAVVLAAQVFYDIKDLNPTLMQK